MWQIDKIQPEERQQWLIMRHQLWPDSDFTELQQETEEIIKQPDILPVFVARNSEKELIGFLEAAFRDYVDGCNSTPVPYIEGLYVKPEYRNQGIAKALIQTMENWAKQQGYTEIASDTTLENIISQTLHQQLGFEAVERIIIWRKSI
ncbi:aminoglycoside 6'-N-acetyltransferase [Gloeothece verrucosa]|uniref:Aminoglycoside N(6')-acetyltransferase type 1 n=1 Tax=Gloeothece verrucosa (strain PCC 7822) TaxID=497965 RepID=E0U9R3_GLOV7|nr:aminoglycoside 6'-N-acetyltransferase [Gloeothece verrucosa]ADN14983.1 GCN5-related N-acetyltransferase [Gloeothece verrucosa PCC 7822]